MTELYLQKNNSRENFPQLLVKKKVQETKMTAARNSDQVSHWRKKRRR
jgi:hypothetical protein